MAGQINLSDIYDKNLNFLIGSGASSGLFPTLGLKIKDSNGIEQTIETLATEFEKDNKKNRMTMLFMHYYKSCIEPVLEFDLEKCKADKDHKIVIENYEKFIKTILLILRKKKKNDLRLCNVFTTNYDGCIAHVADDIIKSGVEEFVLNDGARGFFRRYLSAKNYNSHVRQSGVFDRYSTQVPQINLIHIHGSAYWKKDEESIRVDYGPGQKLDNGIIRDLASFSSILGNGEKKVSDIQEIDLTEDQIKDFWSAYNRLPVVNPRKWKFHETVFEEHYYQMLRHLSYELEKPSTVLITFGFSFADEHILNLVKRSLGNPSLQVFASCFNEAERVSLTKKFEKFKNIVFLTGDGGVLDFSKFNADVFTLKDPSA